jgi:DNA-binding NarL/FixJ family response regulator
MKSHISVFIIDDDPDDSELLTEAILEVDPNIVCSSSSGSIGALTILSVEQLIIPDFIFLDLNMPMMNGKECLVELRKIQQLNSAKVVVYTTSQREDDVKEMLGLSAAYFLIKPSSFDHLKKAINYIIHGVRDADVLEGLFER